MKIKKPGFISRWRTSSQERLGLDVLLGQAPTPSAPLRERLNWLSRLTVWARVKDSSSDNSTQQDLGTRFKYILQILDNNLEIKERVAETLRSIIHDTSALELFMNLGIPNQEGFLGELFERIQFRLLPQPPHDNDLVFVFSETFSFSDDAILISEMDPSLFQEWVKLFQYSKGTVDPGWNSLIRDARDALQLLAQQASVIGLSQMVRRRSAINNFHELPFFKLPEKADLLLAAVSETELNSAYKELNFCLFQCFEVIGKVQVYFREQGASLFLIYQMIRLKFILLRIQNICQLIAGYKDNPVAIQEFMSSLIYENVKARGVKGLLEDNMVLVSQKIIETNAETGEHYITRDRKEYVTILKKALGGGFLTGFTILFKFIILRTKLAPFISGLFQSLNYAIRFWPFRQRVLL